MESTILRLNFVRRDKNTSFPLLSFFARRFQVNFLRVVLINSALFGKGFHTRHFVTKRIIHLQRHAFSFHKRYERIMRDGAAITVTFIVGFTARSDYSVGLMRSPI